MDKENDLIEIIAKARAEGIKRGIEANSIIINKNLRYVKPFAMAFEDGPVGLFPPMIMGMEINSANQLPNSADFIIFESKITERDKIVAEIKKQAVKEFAEWVIDLLYANSVANEAEQHTHIASTPEELQDEINAKVKELYGSK